MAWFDKILEIKHFQRDLFLNSRPPTSNTASLRANQMLVFLLCNSLLNSFFPSQQPALLPVTAWRQSGDVVTSGPQVAGYIQPAKCTKYINTLNTQIHKYTNTQIHKHKYNCDQWASGGRIYTAPAKCIQTLTPTRKKARHITQFSTGRTKKDVLLKMSRQKIQSHPWKNYA